MGTGGRTKRKPRSRTTVTPKKQIPTDGRPLSGAERRRLYFKGFGDGAKCSVIKHPRQTDYEAGYVAGRKAANEATKAYSKEHGLPKPNFLRAQEK